MANYKLGEIVLLKFPFTSNVGFKKRPALIIKDTNDGDVIVCRITSKLYYSPYDIVVNLDRKLGEVDNNIKVQVINVIQTLLA